MRISRNFELNRADGAWIVGLVLASLALYAQTLNFEFVRFDDQTILTNHPDRYVETSLVESARAIFVSDFPREEPLVVRDLSWALDARLFGFDNAGAYHRTNVVLNGLVVCLLFVFLRRLRLSTVLAGGVSLVFALLPIHIEVVSWVMGRKDLLVATFILLGLLAQHQELESESRREKASYYLIVLVCLLLAMGSKISALSFCIVLGAHRFFYPYLSGARSPVAAIEWRRDVMRTVPPLIPHVILSAIVFSWYRSRLSEFGIIESDQAPGPLDPQHLLNMATFLPLIAAQYLENVFMPGELSVYYRWPHVAIPLSTFERVASVAWAVGILSGLAYCLRRRRDMAFYPLMTLGLLAPYGGFFYVGFWYADRYMYLASAGLLTIVALSTRELVAQRPNLRFPAIAIVSLFALMGGLHVWEGQTRWRDDESLWLYETSREEPALLGFYALGRQYSELASDAQDPAIRREWALTAKAVADGGLARSETLALQRTNYPIPEISQIAHLHAINGLAVGILGAPPMMRAAHYRRAFEIFPDLQSSILLSRVLAEAAQDLPDADRQAMIEESFEYFHTFIAMAASDPVELEKSGILLEKNYGDRYPFLAPRIAEVKELYFQ